ncbi:hypothetical protein ABG067_006894 [Albugo candida]
MTRTVRIEAALCGILICMTPKVCGKTAGGNVPTPLKEDLNDHSTIHQLRPSIRDGYKMNDSPIQTQIDHPVDTDKQQVDSKLDRMQRFDLKYTPGASSDPYLPKVTMHLLNELKRLGQPQANTEKLSEIPSLETTSDHQKPNHQTTIQTYQLSDNVEPSSFPPVKYIPRDSPFRQGLRNYLKEKREAPTARQNSNNPPSTDSASISDLNESPADTFQE